jgi:hypothetical protein
MASSRSARTFTTKLAWIGSPRIQGGYHYMATVIYHRPTRTGRTFSLLGRDHNLWKFSQTLDGQQVAKFGKRAKSKPWQQD